VGGDTGSSDLIPEFLLDLWVPGEFEEAKDNVWALVSSEETYWSGDVPRVRLGTAYVHQ